MGHLMRHQLVVGPTGWAALWLTFVQPEPDDGTVVLFTCQERVRSGSQPEHFPSHPQLLGVRQSRTKGYFCPLTPSSSRALVFTSTPGSSPSTSPLHLPGHSQMQPTIRFSLTDGTRVGCSRVPPWLLGGNMLYGS